MARKFSPVALLPLANLATAINSFRKSKDTKRLAIALIRYINTRVVSLALRAYVFAYLYIILPKVFSTIVRYCRQQNYSAILPRIWKLLRSGVKGGKFPALAGQLLLRINIMEPLFFLFFKKTGVFRSTRANLAISTFFASFVASLTTFPRFQKHVSSYNRHNSLDLTLLIATRAVDTALSSALLGVGGGSYAAFGDGALFVISSALIMYSWFFFPERLPPAYRNWITLAANMDDDIVKLLKLVKEKKVIYGQHGEADEMMENYCKRYNRDPAEGLLVTNIPLLCEVVHAFKTPNCELHALWRFVRGFQFAFKLYGGLNLFMLLIPRKNSTFANRLWRSLQLSVRSSCFLATYIAFTWYGVCLARTRLLPKLFPNVPRERWDDTICVASGAFLSGFSCFVDTPQRRKELALFVAPRAVGTLVSAELSERNLRIEAVVFAISMAVIVAYSRQDARKVRGIFGKGLETVFSIPSYA